MSRLTEDFVAARRVSTPLIAIRTPDPTSTIEVLLPTFTQDEPVLKWDLVGGAEALTETGATLLDVLKQHGVIMTKAHTLLAGLRATKRSGDALTELIPEGTVVFMINAHRFLRQDEVVQAAWNLRDPFKANRRALVMLGPDFQLPPELSNDVTVLDEPLPTPEEMVDVVRSQFDNAGLAEPTGDVVTSGVDAIRGLAKFPAEQAVAMCLTHRGLDMRRLLERTKEQICQTPGLSVLTFPDTLDGLGSLTQIKRFLGGVMRGSRPPGIIVVIEEIEKKIAGVHGDNTGVSQDQMSVMLTEMEDNDWPGIIFFGHPGSGKSGVCKALGNSYGKRTLGMDTGSMRQKHVGESEARIRGAMKVIKALAGPGGALFIASCNGVAELPAELLRRFRMGLWMFDLPTKDERETIWPINLKRYGLAEQARPEDTDWTGSDIRNVCELADSLRIPIAEAAQYIVPVCKSDPDAISRRRALAHNRFLSASRPGPYQNPEATKAAPPAGRQRQIRPAS